MQLRLQRDLYASAREREKRYHFRTSTRSRHLSLQNRVVLVTGGATGIGEAIVRRLAEQGARVGFLDVKTKEGEALAASLAEQGWIARFERVDLTDVAATRRAIDKVREVLGGVTILINNAADDERHSLDSVTPEYWDERIAVNLKHHFFCAQAVVPDMKEAANGSIINMGSVSWMVGQGGMPVYTACKSAVLGLTRSLARDLGPFNIRVNSIAPGWIMTQRQLDRWLTPEGEAELLSRQCLKRKLYPDEIARAVLFFASDEASACTNQTCIVDGGWL